MAHPNSEKLNTSLNNFASEIYIQHENSPNCSYHRSNKIENALFRLKKKKNKWVLKWNPFCWDQNKAKKSKKEHQMGVKKKKKNVTLLNVKGDHRREKLLKEKVRERERERGDSLSKTNGGDSVSETQRNWEMKSLMIWSRDCCPSN